MEQKKKIKGKKKKKKQTNKKTNKGKNKTNKLRKKQQKYYIITYYSYKPNKHSPLSSQTSSETK